MWKLVGFFKKKRTTPATAPATTTANANTATNGTAANGAANGTAIPAATPSPAPATTNGATAETPVVCIKVPEQRDPRRAEYEACEGDREAWLQRQLGPNGVYVARPKNDGGWYGSSTVKAGSMFANPFPTTGKNAYTVDESMRRFTEYARFRASPNATTKQVIKLLPPATQKLAQKRHKGGEVHEEEGKSVAHLQLDVVGLEFETALGGLRGKTLGCWCDPEEQCHAKILARLAGFAKHGVLNEAWTITWGDVARNEVKMQPIGEAAEHGVSVARLQEIKEELEAKGIECVLIDLVDLLPEEEREAAREAAVLVVRKGVAALSENPEGEAELLAEQQSMPIDEKAYDDKYPGGVFNKKNRYNNLLGDEDQAPDYGNKKGTVVDCEAVTEDGSKKYPTTSKLRAVFTSLLCAAHPVVGETNKYFNAFLCGIGWHGDRERKMVAGVRLGLAADGMPLKFMWFRDSKLVGAEGRILLNAGDVYFMSEKAVGFDWLTKKELTLRHAAGAENYSSVDTLKVDGKHQYKSGELPRPPVQYLLGSATAEDEREEESEEEDEGRPSDRLRRKRKSDAGSAAASASGSSSRARKPASESASESEAESEEIIEAEDLAPAKRKKADKPPSKKKKRQKKTAAADDEAENDADGAEDDGFAWEDTNLLQPLAAGGKKLILSLKDIEPHHEIPQTVLDEAGKKAEEWGQQVYLLAATMDQGWTITASMIVNHLMRLQKEQFVEKKQMNRRSSRWPSGRTIWIFSEAAHHSLVLAARCGGTGKVVTAKNMSSRIRRHVWAVMNSQSKKGRTCCETCHTKFFNHNDENFDRMMHEDEQRREAAQAGVVFEVCKGCCQLVPQQQAVQLDD